MDQSDWCSWDGNESNETTRNSHTGTGHKGGMNLFLSVCSLLATAAVSFLICYFTKDLDKRPAALIGLVFALPAAAVMFSALFTEMLTDAMTPTYSRKGQLGVAAATVFLCFFVGCFGEIIHFAVFQQPVQSTSSNYILLLDKSGSMDGPSNNESERAVYTLLNQTPDGTSVGFVAYSDVILSTVSFSPLNDQKRNSIISASTISIQGGTNFELPIEEALNMLHYTPIAGQPKTQIILITDGVDTISSEKFPLLRQRCIDQNASISCVRITSYIDSTLAELIVDTNGLNLEVQDASQLLGNLLTINTVSQSEYDVLHNLESETYVTAAIMLVIEGLLLGIALSLMLSRQHQKRFQIILSPLMGVCAFILCKVVFPINGMLWINEALAFTCYGIVFMKKNK